MLQKVSPATVLAGFALFFALTGGAYAGAQALIGSAQIKDRSIQLRDLAPSTVKALRGQRGAPGPVGATGPAGPAGGFDPAKVTHVAGPVQSIPAYGAATLRAACPAGTALIGGGYIGGTLTAADVPIDQEWVVVVGNLDDEPIDRAFAVAICAAR